MKPEEVDRVLKERRTVLSIAHFVKVENEIKANEILDLYAREKQLEVLERIEKANQVSSGAVRDEIISIKSGFEEAELTDRKGNNE